MTQPIIQGALAEPRLRPGSKRVYFAVAPSFVDDPDPPLPLGERYQLSQAAARSLAELLLIIESDCDPEKLTPYYRASAVGDKLLHSPWRVMHLHLIDTRSNDIVYLVQREDGSVIIVEVSDHRHLRTIPRGANLRRDRALAAASRADQALILQAITAVPVATAVASPTKVVLKPSAKFPLPKSGPAYVLLRSKKSGTLEMRVRRVPTTRPKTPPED